MFVLKSQHMESTTNRIIGFDLARAYALFGMFIVNFNTVFGSHANHEGLSGFLNLFNGNSSTLFVVLAGMGVALMSNRQQYDGIEKKKITSIVVKRSWFLFFAGLLLYVWWPADILHFYGGYMHIAALLLFLSSANAFEACHGASSESSEAALSNRFKAFCVASKAKRPSGGVSPL